jgi:ABC-type uncharacterized transport system permease subunit
MDPATHAAFIVGVIGYSVALTLFVLDLARSERTATVAIWGRRMLAIGGVFHLVHVTGVSLLTHTCPLGSVHFALSMAALVAVAGTLILLRRPALHAIGTFVAPLALVFLVASEFVGTGRPGGAVSRRLLAVHVAANLLGLAMFLLAAVAATLYLVEERRLRDKHLVFGLRKLPPLEVLEQTLYRLLLLGFPLLTVGLVTGAAFASRSPPQHLAGEARAVLSYATWIVVGVVLVSRRVAGWRGHRAACGAIVGALCITLVVALYVAIPSVGGVP